MMNRTFGHLLTAVHYHLGWGSPVVVFSSYSEDFLEGACLKGCANYL